jgi:hypothetical protein
MSDTHHTTPPAERLETGRFGFLQTAFLGAGLLALIVSVLVGWSQPRTLAFSWLYAFAVCYTVLAGSLFWILLHHAVDANWTVVVRRILEKLAGLFPVLAVAFLPMIFFKGELWKWMKLAPGADALLDWKAGYLNQPFFWSRAGAYLLFFCVAAYLYKKFSTDQDRDGNPWKSLTMRKMSYAFIPLFGVSLTFSAFDWLMALDHHWFSTMWGVYIFAGAAQSSMALLILVSNGLRRAGYLGSVMTAEHNHIMGKLLFAFTVFWAYISFSQYMLIWYANIPEETTFFFIRNTDGWFWVSVALVVGHFFIPFTLLLTQPAKQNAARLCPIAGWVLLMHLLDHYWITIPMRNYKGGLEASVVPALTDVTCLVALVGILGFFFLRSLARHSLFPARDPRLVESINLKN